MVQAQHPSQFGVKKMSKTRWQGQNSKSIDSRGEELAETRAAQVLKGGGGRNRTNHLHTAFGSCGTCHRKHTLVFHLCSCYTYHAHRYTHIHKSQMLPNACMFLTNIEKLLSRYVHTKHSLHKKLTVILSSFIWIFFCIFQNN